MKYRAVCAAAIAAVGMGLSTSTFGAAITVSTVGSYAPGVTGGPTINDAVSNSLTNGITLANFRTLVSGAFSSDTGGVWNGDATSGVTYGTTYGETAATPVTATYGTSQGNSLSFYRADGVAGTTGFSDNNNNGTNVVSGNGYIGFSGNGQAKIVFSTGLSAVGFTEVPRGALRLVSLTAVLDDSSTISTSTETITAANAPGAIFFGLSAPAGRTITGLNVSSTDGTGAPQFARFDDLGFVVASSVPAPEPASIGLIVLGAAALTLRRRRRLA